MTSHNPGKGYECLGCATPWPCEQRRRELLAERGDLPKLLRAEMTEHFVTAATGELRLWPAGELAQRFVGWLPPRYEAAIFTWGDSV